MYVIVSLSVISMIGCYQVEPDEDTVYIPDNEQDAPPFQPCRSPTSMMQMAYNQTIPVEALQGTDISDTMTP